MKQQTGKFTIHFATINTEYGQALSLDKTTFTIHFATINTFGYSSKT